MNKIIRALIVVALSIGFSVSAQTLVGGPLTNGVNSVVASQIAVTQLQLTDTSGTNNQVIIYDNSSSSTTNIVLPSYVSRALSRATNSTVFTNFAGVTQTNNFPYMSSVLTTNAASTNEARRVYTVTVPANGSVTIIPDTALTVGLGLQVKTSGTMTYNLTYLPLP